MRRFLAVLGASAICVVTGVVTTAPSSGAAPRPVAPHERKAPLHTPAPGSVEGSLTAAAARDAASRVRTAPSDVGVLAVSDEVHAAGEPLVVGMVWDGSQDDVVVEYRTRARAGAPWSAWQAASEDDEHGPDAGTAEAKHSRPGSDPVAVGSGTSVQLRAVGARNRVVPGLTMPVIDPGTAPADATVGTSSGGTASAVAQRPVIYTRADWGADESIRTLQPEYGAVQAAIVHHTVNSNTYSAADVPALIRGIYAFHVNGRGWGDIGYNFLIDRFGRIWEGRYGGTTRAVIGAQAKGVNSWSFGAATIGDFTNVSAPSAVVSAYTRLVAWKAQIHQFDPGKPANLAGTVYRGVNGHRDVNQTSCPGAGLYKYVPQIASAASAQVRGLPSLSVDHDVDNAGGNDVIATNANHDLLFLHAEDGQIQRPRTISSGGWVGMDLAITPGDWNGDRVADILARQTDTGALRLYAGNGVGSLQAGRDVGHGWQAMSRLTGVNDLDGDGRSDLVAVDGAQKLRIYPGNGKGGFSTSRVIGTGWGAIAKIVGVGDWDGNGRMDVLGVTTGGTAIVYRWIGTRLTTLAVLGGGWD
ncbi:MAG TPA: FG-GAP-like repeat-containing protein, partial [Phycicoccus sp.]